MTYDEIDNFCETYAMIERRAEEYFKIFREDHDMFGGIEVDEYGVRIRYTHYCYGEGEEETMNLPYEILEDFSIDLKEKYAEEIEEKEWLKMLKEERAEKQAKENAKIQIEALKKQYNL